MEKIDYFTAKNDSLDETKDEIQNTCMFEEERRFRLQLWTLNPLPSSPFPPPFLPLAVLYFDSYLLGAAVR